MSRRERLMVAGLGATFAVLLIALFGYLILEGLGPFSLQVGAVFQELDNLPGGFRVPAGRVKPWGTAHAVLSCRDVIEGSFAVINADDFYGRSAYQSLAEFRPLPAGDGGAT